MRRPSTLVCLTLLLFASTIARGESRCRVETHDGVTVLHLYGDYYTMGQEQGRLLGDRIAKTVDFLVGEMPTDGSAELATLPKRYHDELRGLAEGSGIELKRLLAAHARMPRLTGSEMVALGSRTQGGRALHAVSIEPEPNRPDPLLVVYHPPDGVGYVSVTWPGYLGAVAGLNEEGIGVSLLDVEPRPDATMQPPATLWLREALRQGKTLSKASDILKEARGIRGNFLLSDGRLPKAQALEIADGQSSVFGAGDVSERNPPHAPLTDAIRRSNHFVDSRLSTAVVDPASLERYQFWQKVLETGAENRPLSPLDVVQSLAEIRRQKPGTIGLLLEPSELRIWAGTSATDGGLVTFSLPALLAGQALAKTSVADQTKGGVAQGIVQPAPRQDENALPEAYRMNSDAFTYEIEPEKVVRGVLRDKVRFPSPHTTKYPENNTVHAEFFRPFGKGPFACVIVLHIAGGDFELSRFVANAIAQGGTAALFVKMPYYGERRPPGTDIKMLSPDVDRSSQAMEQVVVDLRRACDWIESREDLDGRIGIIGISLGSITGALSAALEPRISHVFLIMGGGGLHHIIFGSVEGEAVSYRKIWTERGGTLESLAEVMAPFDPLTYGDRLRGRVVHMIGASQDESVPPISTLLLWEAAGRQKITWYPCGHYTIVRHILPVLNQAVAFFNEWPSEPVHDTTPLGTVPEIANQVSAQPAATP